MPGSWSLAGGLPMSSDISIRVHALGKAFPVYDKPHHRLMQMITPGPKDRWYRTFRALNDVSFEVRRGETVGIVGRNGSGKSTLLQLICGTLTPTMGMVQAHGRIAALLELGAGFNPDFTGRENVYLNGSLLGLTRQQLDERFDDIVAFADIGEFIEQPVKSYSSGMYIRLAFAVAINVTPDILVIDEALSVGDEAFQRKCFARIDTIRDAGATVLFVSHSAGSVIELCDRALLLDRGELIAMGTPKHVISHYHKLIYAPADKREAVRESIRHGVVDAHGTLSIEGVAKPNEVTEPEDEACFEEDLLPQSTVRYVSRGAMIEDPHIETPKGRRVNVLRHGQEYVYTYRVSVQRAAAAVRFGMMIKTLAGFELGGGVSTPHGTSELIVSPGQSFVVRFRFQARLASGTYFMNAGVTALEDDGETYLDRIVDAAMFRVMPDPYRLGTGSADFLMDVDVNELAGASA
jgi:lipopolysaccharide transport system ATP-binding protein